jgi:hypothetical protein
MSVSVQLNISVAGSNVAKNLSDPSLWARYIPMFLQTLADQVQQDIVKYMLSEANFKNPSGIMRKSVKSKAEEGGVFVYFDPIIAPHAIYIVGGVKPHTMYYLMGATKRTPINTDRRPLGAPSPIPLQGGKLFRWATAKSISEGKWKHPGYTGLASPQRAVPMWEWVIEQLRPVFAEKSRMLVMQIAHTGAS